MSPAKKKLCADLLVFGCVLVAVLSAGRGFHLPQVKGALLSTGGGERDYLVSFQIALASGIALRLSLVCTLVLVAARVRSCFSVHHPFIGRDIVLLIAGPIAAGLYAINALFIRMQSQEIMDPPGQFAPVEVPEVCFWVTVCFIVGVLSCLLPNKAAVPTEQSGRSAGSR